MSADDEWWAAVGDPIEDALADCRNGHHGSGSVVLAEYVDQLRARVTALEKAVLAGASDLQPVVAWLSAVPEAAQAVHPLAQRAFDALFGALLDVGGLTASADHG